MVANTLDSSSPDGQQGQPGSDNLEGTNVQPPSTPAPDQVREQLGVMVSEAVVKALQDPNILKGMKDRRFNQIEKELKDISPVLERVKELLTPEQQAQFAQIQRDAEFEELKQAVYGGRETRTGVQPQTGNQGGAALDLEAVVNAIVMSFPENDLEAAAVKFANKGNLEAQATELAKLRIARAGTKPAGPAQGLPPSGGQSGSSTKSKAQLQKEYETQSAQIAQTMGGDAKIRALSNLKVKYREAGLEV